MILVDLIDRLLMLCGGRVTTRSAAAEFGPPPGARYAAELAAYSDAELMLRERDDILAEIKAAESRRTEVTR